MRGKVLGLVVACGVLSGCSVFFTRHTTLPVAPTDPVRCTESRAAPAVDTVLAAAFTAATVALVVNGATAPAQANSVECGSCFAYAAALAVGVYAVGAGVIAKIGYDRTTECQRIHEWQRRCLAGERDACAALQVTAP
jgi:hypothetical protein